MENTTKGKIKAVNETLKKGEANKNYSEDHKGYSGYTPQSVLDAVNGEFLGDWNIEVLEHKTYPLGEKIHAFTKVKVTLSGVSMEAFASHPIQTDPGDAFKSAQTDAMKKAFAHFSIGRRAYHGLIGK